ncbi:MAG: hypothetical protein AB6733_12245 [Clostridiaceae bacterium]
MENYEQDASNYINLLKEFDTLQDNEFDKAYIIHKQALAQYNRWSAILHDIRIHETRGNKSPAVKDRIEEIMRVLNNIYTSARMVWNKAKDDLNEGKY